MFSTLPKETINDIVQWDVKTWSTAIDYWEAHVDWSKPLKGMELGGREGGLSLWMALKGVDVVCSDLEGVKETATPLHVKYNLAQKIHYQDIDATNIPYENHFDVICFKSIIGGVGRDGHSEKQQKAFNEIYKALKPGGRLLFAENLVASPMHRTLRSMFVRWGNSWRYVTTGELKSFMNKFSSVEIQTTGVASAFGRSESQRNMLASVDQSFLNHIFPRDWKYIAYGVAVK